jgi:hypothetical protein
MSNRSALLEHLESRTMFSTLQLYSSAGKLVETDSFTVDYGYNQGKIAYINDFNFGNGIVIYLSKMSSSEYVEPGYNEEVVISNAKFSPSTGKLVSANFSAFPINAGRSGVTISGKITG